MRLGLWKKPDIPRPMPATEPDDPGPFVGNAHRELKSNEQIESEPLKVPVELPPR